RKSSERRLGAEGPGWAVAPWHPEQSVMKISLARVCSRAGTGACCLRAGMRRSGLGASCGLVCCTPGCARTTPDRPDRASAASQMRFIEFSPRISMSRFWPDYSGLEDRGNRAFELLQGE